MTTGEAKKLENWPMTLGKAEYKRLYCHGSILIMRMSLHTILAPKRRWLRLNSSSSPLHKCRAIIEIACCYKLRDVSRFVKSLDCWKSAKPVLRPIANSRKVIDNVV